jgi:hypothetical protein
MSTTERVAAFGSRSTISGWAAISPSRKSSRFAHYRVHRRLDYPASLGLDPHCRTCYAHCTVTRTDLYTAPGCLRQKTGPELKDNDDDDPVVSEYSTNATWTWSMVSRAITLRSADDSRSLAVLRQNLGRRQVVDLSALIRRESRSMITLLLHRASTPPVPLRRPPPARGREPGPAAAAGCVQKNDGPTQAAPDGSPLLDRAG